MTKLFLRQALAFSWWFAAAAPFLLRTARGFPSGAGGCEGGRAAVGGSHLEEGGGGGGGKGYVTGPLSDGRLDFLLNNRVADADAPFVQAFAGERYDVTVITVPDTGAFFRGALIRVEGAAAADAATTFFTLQAGVNAQGAGVCDEQPGDVVGITHTDNEAKTQLGGTLTFDATGEATVDVTVVVSNNATDSIYYYSGFTLSVVAPDEPQPVAPAASPAPNDAAPAPVEPPTPAADGPVAPAPATAEAPAAPTSGASRCGRGALATTLMMSLVFFFATWWL
jgi:hypothetical protein